MDKKGFNRTGVLRWMMLVSIFLTTETWAGEKDIFEEPGQWPVIDGKFTIENVSDDVKEGEKCLKVVFNPSGGEGLLTQTDIPGVKNWDRLSFWLKSPSSGNIGLRFNPKDYSFEFGKWIKIDSPGWFRVDIPKSDFKVEANEGIVADWDKVTYCYFSFSGDKEVTVYFDGIRLLKPEETLKKDKRYETLTLGAQVAKSPQDKKTENERPPISRLAGDIVIVNSCEKAESWKTDGELDVLAKSEFKQEGERCLYIHYTGKGTGSVTTSLPDVVLTKAHVLVFKLRGPSATAKARFYVQLFSANGASFHKELGIANFEWFEVLLFPGDFANYQMIPNSKGEMPDWTTIRTITFKVENDSSEEQGNILLDAVTFRKISTTGTRIAAPDKKFWWWNGGYDPFLAMHTAYADWPHLESQLQHRAPLKFSEFILSPFVPYSVYIHNDKDYERLRLTITDWELDPVKVVELAQPKKGIIEINLIVPARVGTYLFNLERYEKGNITPERYQTGIMVLAKRLREPSGIWGLHASLLSAGGMDGYFDLIMDMFQAVGVTGLREDMGMPGGRSAEEILSGLATRRLPYYKMAKTRNIGIIGTIGVQDHRELYMSIGRNQSVPTQFIPPFLKDIENITRAYKGLVDWFELGNEMNERALPPYAEILKKSYVAAKRGDPDCKFTMNGCHTIDEWQKGLWEMEKAETDPNYKTYQDTLATHLYPDLQGVEPTLREWLKRTIGEEALKAKGMLMTESGWPVFQINLQNLLKSGMLPPDYSGELDFQCYMAMYGPVLLGEHLKIDAKLHGVCFFVARQVTMDGYLFDAQGNAVPDGLRVGGCGHFTSRYNNEEITLARPAVYTHNTLARLLTHEVTPADVEVKWDNKQGEVERYSFRRPGETILAVWIGPPANWQHQPRARQLSVSVSVPEDTGLILAVDINGNEKVLKPKNGVVNLNLTRPEDVQDASGKLLYLRSGQPVFLRFLQGKHVDNVFFQNIQSMPQDGYRIVKGTPEGNSELVNEISKDRNLPVINDAVPVIGEPIVFYSDVNNTVYLVGRTETDVKRASAAFDEARESVPK